MALTRDTFCSFCGTAYPTPLSYPRTCTKCSTQVWANPIPVSVVLLPVKRDADVGLLVIRRAIPPGVGKLALVGGFLEEHETWQEGGARELREETGISIQPSGLTPFWFTSTEPRPNRVLLFSVAPVMPLAMLVPFNPDHETSERGVIFGARGLDEVFAFPLHAEAARKYFAAQGIDREHGFVAA